MKDEEEFPHANVVGEGFLRPALCMRCHQVLPEKAMDERTANPSICNRCGRPVAEEKQTDRYLVSWWKCERKLASQNK